MEVNIYKHKQPFSKALWLIAVYWGSNLFASSKKSDSVQAEKDFGYTF